MLGERLLERVIRLSRRSGAARDAARRAAASIRTRHAAARFRPHRWADRADPDEGLL